MCALILLIILIAWLGLIKTAALLIILAVIGRLID